MNLKSIFVFCLFRVIELVTSSDKLECVKRKSGTCKALNVTEDFDRFIDLKVDEDEDDRYRVKFDEDPLNTIIEFDYSENKYSYERGESKNGKEFEFTDNPVIEILFSEEKASYSSYRLVLGEKLSRLAYLQVTDYDMSEKTFNNYSPDLPSWPFAISVTIGRFELMVHTRDGDGFDKSEPFLNASLGHINIKYMSVRSKNKNVKIVGFYDCSTKYGANCGFESMGSITDCREKFSPLGSGFFNTFVNMNVFKRSDQGNGFELDEIFGVYRRSNDSCVILFSPLYFESGTYIRITIGDEISVRLRIFDRNSDTYFKKDAIMKGWNQEPSQPNFVRIKISSVTNDISIYNIHSTSADADNAKPILTMKLCNYFERFGTRIFMSITSYRFKTVKVYYDCKKNGIRTRMKTVSTTASPYSENNRKYNPVVNKYFGDEHEVEFKENGWSDTKTYLNTTDFREPRSVQYIYENGSNVYDYCEGDLQDVQLEEFTESPHTDGDSA